jgi:uncharacterized protein (DUF302 family)
MKLALIIASTLLIVSGCSQQTKNAQSKFIKDYIINDKVDSAITKIQNALKDKNYIITSTFNHEAEALKLKKMLYPNKTINLYNSKISTKLLQCNPTMSQEMPLRLSVYSELNGKTHISFTDPEYWSIKHNIKDAECLNLIVLLKKDLYSVTDALGIK